MRWLRLYLRTCTLKKITWCKVCKQEALLLHFFQEQIHAREICPRSRLAAVKGALRDSGLEKYRVTSSPGQLNVTLVIGSSIELNQANKRRWTRCSFDPTTFVFLTAICPV